jgi:hypothetical protein
LLIDDGGNRERSVAQHRAATLLFKMGAPSPPGRSGQRPPTSRRDERSPPAIVPSWRYGDALGDIARDPPPREFRIFGFQVT